MEFGDLLSVRREGSRRVSMTSHLETIPEQEGENSSFDIRMLDFSDFEQEEECEDLIHDIETMDLSNFEQMKEAIEYDCSVPAVTTLLIRLKLAYNETVDLLYPAKVEYDVKTEEGERRKKIRDGLNIAREHREATQVLMEKMPQVQSGLDEILAKKNSMQDLFDAKCAQIEEISQKGQRELLQDLESTVEHLTSLDTEKLAAVMMLQKQIENEKMSLLALRDAKLRETEEQLLWDFRGKELEHLRVQKKLDACQAERDNLLVKLSDKQTEIDTVRETRKEIEEQFKNCTTTTGFSGTTLSKIRANLRKVKCKRDRMKTRQSAVSKVVNLAEADNAAFIKEIQDERRLHKSLIKEFKRISKENEMLESVVQQMKDTITQLTRKCRIEEKLLSKGRQDLETEELELQDLERLLRTRINEWEFCLTRLQMVNRTFLMQKQEGDVIQRNALIIKRESIRNNNDVSSLFKRCGFLALTHDSKVSAIRRLQEKKKSFQASHTQCKSELAQSITHKRNLEKHVMLIENVNIDMVKGNMELTTSKAEKEEELIRARLQRRAEKDKMKNLVSQAISTRHQNRKLVRLKQNQKTRLLAIENQLTALTKDMDKQTEDGQFVEFKIKCGKQDILRSKKQLIEKDILIIEVRRQRDVMGSILIDKMKELDLASEYLSTLERLQNVYKKEYSNQQENLDLLKREYSRLRRKHEQLEEGAEFYGILKCEDQIQAKELNKLKARCTVLQESKPVHIHRWRYIKAVDPSMYSLHEKICFLLMNLRDKGDEVERLQILTDGREKLLSQLQKVYVSRETPEQLRAKQAAINDTSAKHSKRIRVMETGLRATQHNLSRLEHEVMTTDDELRWQRQRLVFTGLSEVKKRNKRCVGITPVRDLQIRHFNGKK